MEKNDKARRVLFSGKDALDTDQAVQLIMLGADMLKSIKDKELIITAIRFALSDTKDDIKDSHQVLHFFNKWKANESSQIRSFILSELREITLSASVGHLTVADVENLDTNKEIKKQVKRHAREIKESLRKKLVEKFGAEYVTKVAPKLKVKDYALVRFFREDRVPGKAYLHELFKLLGITDLEYQKQ